MNIERKIVVHLSAWDIIRSLRQTHPTILGLQAMHDEKAKVVMEVGKSVLVLTYTIPGPAPVIAENVPMLAAPVIVPDDDPQAV
jgi:hypothetical protein